MKRFLSLALSLCLLTLAGTLFPAALSPAAALAEGAPPPQALPALSPEGFLGIPWNTPLDLFLQTARTKAGLDFAFTPDETRPGRNYFYNYLTGFHLNGLGSFSVSSFYAPQEVGGPMALICFDIEWYEMNFTQDQLHQGVAWGEGLLSAFRASQKGKLLAYMAPYVSGELYEPGAGDFDALPLPEKDDRLDAAVLQQILDDGYDVDLALRAGRLEACFSVSHISPELAAEGMPYLYSFLVRYHNPTLPPLAMPAYTDYETFRHAHPQPAPAEGEGTEAHRTPDGKGLAAS